MMNMKLKRISITVALFAAVLISACAKPRIAVDPSFWDHKEARIGVAIATYPEAAAFKAGAQGLLDMGINAAMASDLKAHLLTLKPDEFDTLRDRFSAELQKHGIQGKAIPAPMNLEMYAKFEKPADSSSEFFEKDLRPLEEKESIGFLVLLSVDGFGTLRKYYGFIPLGVPQGYCKVSGRLVDLRNNQLMWSTTSAEKESTVAVEGAWDQPPNYPNLTEAIKKAITASQEVLFKDFFGEGQGSSESGK